jgi:hypothetical protein
MVRQTKDVEQELYEKQIQYGLYQIESCSEEDNAKYAEMAQNGEPLPKNVHQYKDTVTDQYVDQFYYLKDSKLTDSEWQEYLRYLELDRLDTIKNCLLFFTVLTVISLILGFIVFVS